MIAQLSLGDGELALRLALGDGESLRAAAQAYTRAVISGSLADARSSLLLEQASDMRDPAIIDLSAEPRFEPLGSDPRYQALVGKLALSD